MFTFTLHRVCFVIRNQSLKGNKDVFRRSLRISLNKSGLIKNKISENFAFKNHSRNLSKSAFIQQQQEQQPPFSPPSYIPKDPPNVDTPTQQAIAQYKQGLITPSKLARLLMSQKKFFLITKDNDHSQVFLIPSKAFASSEQEQTNENKDDDTHMFICFSHQDLLRHFWKEYIIRDTVTEEYAPGILEATPFSILDNIMKLSKLSQLVIDPGAKHMVSYKAKQFLFLKAALGELLIEEVLDFVHSHSQHSINPQKSEEIQSKETNINLFMARSLFTIKNAPFLIILKEKQEVTSSDINNTFFVWKKEYIPLWSSLDLLEHFKDNFDEPIDWSQYETHRYYGAELFEKLQNNRMLMRTKKFIFNPLNPQGKEYMFRSAFIQQLHNFQPDFGLFSKEIKNLEEELPPESDFSIKDEK